MRAIVCNAPPSFAPNSARIQLSIKISGFAVLALGGWDSSRGSKRSRACRRFKVPGSMFKGLNENLLPDELSFKTFETLRVVLASPIPPDRFRLRKSQM
jgi:hypothetical protein